MNIQLVSLNTQVKEFLMHLLNDDVYLKLQQGKGFHYLVYVSYIKYINPAKDIGNEHKKSMHLCNNLQHVQWQQHQDPPRPCT
jgi:hypothetical protein